MSCTIKELLDYFNINLELPDKMIKYELGESIEKPEYVEEYHIENVEEGTIHVFITTHEDEKYGNILTYEHILDPQILEWTVIIKSDNDNDDDAVAYSSISFLDEDVILAAHS